MLNFVGIGAQKAGTTWLYERLREHPSISFPAGKEVHFWDFHLKRGLDWYRGLFEVNDGKRHGDITPAYAILPEAQIEQCRCAFPGLRLLYTIRNPIDRAWSAAKMELAKQGRSVAETDDAWFIERFMGEFSLSRGDYERCLRNWSRFYQPDNILVLRYEELERNPDAYLARVYAHLGVGPFTTADPSRLRARVRQGTPEALRPSLRRVLASLYQPKIEALSRYLGQDLADWMRQDNQAMPDE